MQSTNFYTVDENYKGGGISEILSARSTFRTDSIICAIDELLNKKYLYGDDLSGITNVELIILTIESMEREVNNGGWYQFFTNSSVQYAKHLIDSLDKIKCNKVKTNATKAISALKLPNLEPETIANLLASENEKTEQIQSTLSDCDSEYYDCGEDIAEKLLLFIIQNKSEITFK